MNDVTDATAAMIAQTEALIEMKVQIATLATLISGLEAGIPIPQADLDTLKASIVALAKAVSEDKTALDAIK